MSSSASVPAAAAEGAPQPASAGLPRKKRPSTSLFGNISDSAAFVIIVVAVLYIGSQAGLSSLGFRSGAKANASAVTQPSGKSPSGPSFFESFFLSQSDDEPVPTKSAASVSPPSRPVASTGSNQYSSKPKQPAKEQQGDAPETLLGGFMKQLFVQDSSPDSDSSAQGQQASPISRESRRDSQSQPNAASGKKASEGSSKNFWSYILADDDVADAIHNVMGGKSVQSDDNEEPATQVFRSIASLVSSILVPDPDEEIQSPPVAVSKPPSPSLSSSNRREQHVSDDADDEVNAVSQMAKQTLSAMSRLASNALNQDPDEEQSDGDGPSASERAMTEQLKRLSALLETILAPDQESQVQPRRKPMQGHPKKQQSEKQTAAAVSGSGSGSRADATPQSAPKTNAQTPDFDIDAAAIQAFTALQQAFASILVEDPDAKTTKDDHPEIIMRPIASLWSLIKDNVLVADDDNAAKPSVKSRSPTNTQSFVEQLLNDPDARKISVDKIIDSVFVTDPDSGPSELSPQIQAVYTSIFDGLKSLLADPSMGDRPTSHPRQNRQWLSSSNSTCAARVAARSQSTRSSTACL
ncbi:hypothetical protein BC831DRAFT_209175 [Entophlyctis helioformis]|nr:hypothetical protein BC831DRAFT_209175 [Entophlyctis helioformis]